MIGQTFSYIRNKIFTELLKNKNIIKALIVEKENFLDATLSVEQEEYINQPTSLIRKYIYPYKKFFDTITEKKTIITTELKGFRKQGKNYRNGHLTFYILVPVDFEKTTHGVRYDYIADEMETIFEKTTIGEFNFEDRGDIEVGDRYIGHYITFKITEFHIV
jgi:hypothetical protein